jgi:hypothetical protein
MGLTSLDRGYRVTGAVVNLATAGTAGATAIFTVSNNANQIGTKSFKPRKISVQNLLAGTCWLYLGTGVGGTFASVMVPLRCVMSMDTEWTEFELNGIEFFANMTAYPDVLIAGGSLNVQVEGEEIG